MPSSVVVIGMQEHGGDTIVIDEDEGINSELIKQLPVFQEFGVAIYLVDSGVVSEKPAWMDASSPGCCSRWTSVQDGKPKTAAA